MDIQVKEENWWDDLPASIKSGINESIEQAEKAEFISLDEVKKEVNVLFQK